MTLETYSVLVSIGLFLLFAVMVACLVLYALVPAFRKHVHAHSYTALYGSMAAVVLLSIAGAFVYQLAYLTPVCELCWWQRIFLFPIAVIALVAAWYRTKEAHVMAGVLALLGLFYASYHYYYHFQGLVLGNKLALPCSSGGLLPACTDSPILTFGFVTIPFMGILVFSIILAITFFVHRKIESEKSISKNNS